MLEKFESYKKNESSENTNKWEELKADAPETVSSLIAERIDESLESADRWNAIIELTKELNETSPQENRFVIGLLCEVVSVERAAAESSKKQEQYPEATNIARLKNSSF